MKRSVFLIGACILLFAVKIESVKSKDQQRFWELWDSDTANNEPGTPEDKEETEFIIDDEGSGNDADANTHGDDEDFDLNSGDGEPENNEIDKKEPRPTVVTDDEDDDVFGSGSGEDPIFPDFSEPTESIIITEQTTKAKPLSACENLRNSVVDVAGFKPECDIDGSFKRKQCTLDMGTKIRSCWCVSSEGSQIPGTLMNQPDEPDCDLGTNLKGCVFERVQNGQNLLGAPKPRCDINGDWEPIQCLGSQCWCVDKLGNQILDSFVDLPNQPNCDPAPTEKPTTKTPVKELPIGGGYTVNPKDKEKVIVTDIVLGSENSNSNYQEGYRPMKQEEPIFSQPGFLAAIIAGGVITLLLVVLLVMFIVYRMRKKDEGSYPLDEQKFQNYSYSKAPDKEFYA